jgi:hypothetical protein
MRRTSLVLALSLACGLSSIACKQDIGERCERNSDCDSGYCRSAPSLTAAVGGTCQTGPSVPDAATPVDRVDAANDGARDATDATDAADATVDAMTPVDAPSDAADAASSDATDATD